MPQIRTFPPALVRIDGSPGSRRTWVEGLGEQLMQCYEEFRLPSELGYCWATPGCEVAIGDQQPVQVVTFPDTRPVNAFISTK